MIWKPIGVGLEEHGQALLEVWKFTGGGYVRETIEPGEGALAHVAPETQATQFIRVRVTLPERKQEPVEMRIPVGELRDPEIGALFARPENIKGFIEQARMQLVQQSESTQ